MLEILVVHDKIFFLFSEFFKIKIKHLVLTPKLVLAYRNAVILPEKVFFAK
jgi:hypothetical protein